MNPYIGHDSQLRGMEEHRLVGGKGDGMRLLQLRNGKGLEMTVLPDRCCDISRVYLNGVNLSYISPCGYVAPSYFDASDWLRSFTAGFLTTCGLQNVGSPNTDAGEKLELHYDRGTGHGVLLQPFEGILPNVSRRSEETQSDWAKKELEECMASRPCPHCKGQRLSDVSRAVTVGGMAIWQFCELNVTQALDFISSLQLDGAQAQIADQILKEIKARLGFLQSVGLPYLTLSRAAATLSGGEAQRIRLATQIGSSLMGVL